MAALALELCCTLMTDRKSHKNIGSIVRTKVLPQALALVRSSLLQGQALQVSFFWKVYENSEWFPAVWNYFIFVWQSLQRFFASLVHSANTSFDSLLDALLSSAKPSPQSGGLAKQALFSVAQCVAVLCLAAGDQKCSSTVEMLKSILGDDSSSNSVSFHFGHAYVFLTFLKLSFPCLLILYYPLIF